MYGGETGRGHTAFLQIIIIEASAFLCENLNHLSRQEFHVVDTMVANQQLRLRMRFHNHQDTTVRHRIHIITEYIH